MSNPSQTDEWIVETLRNAEVPAPPPGLTSQLVALHPRRRFGKWLAATGIASMAGILVISGTLHPTASLAQVAAAQAEVKQFTLVNTHYLRNGRAFQITESRNGSRWARHALNVEISKTGVKPIMLLNVGIFGDVVMDGKRTVVIKHNPPLMDTVEIDGKTPLYDSRSFDLSTLLKTDGELTKSLGESWHGRRVDRFEIHSKYRDSGRMQTLDRTVIADADTHLPLHVEVHRDSDTWWDSWDYQYETPSESVFEVNIPPTATIYDLPHERIELQHALKTGAVFVSIGQTAQILFPHADERAQPVLPVKVRGSSAQLQANLEVIRKLGVIEPMVYKIDGKEWELANFAGLPFNDAKNFKPLQSGTVSLKIGGHRLLNVPVFHVAMAGTLLRPFLKG